jgi:hypothetical protein
MARLGIAANGLHRYMSGNCRSCPTSCATNPGKFPLVRGDSDTPTDADAPADISAHIDMWRRWRGRWVVLRHRGVGGARRSVGSDRVGHVGAPADRNAPTSVDAYVRTRDAGRVNRGEHFGNSGKRKYPNSKCGPCPPPETHRDLLAAARVPANRCVGVSEVYRRSSRRCLRLVSCRILHNERTADPTARRGTSDSPPGYFHLVIAQAARKRLGRWPARSDRRRWHLNATHLSTMSSTQTTPSALFQLLSCDRWPGRGGPSRARSTVSAWRSPPRRGPSGASRSDGRGSALMPVPPRPIPPARRLE